MARDHGAHEDLRIYPPICHHHPDCIQAALSSCGPFLSMQGVRSLPQRVCGRRLGGTDLTSHRRWALGCITMCIDMHIEVCMHVCMDTCGASVDSNAHPAASVRSASALPTLTSRTGQTLHLYSLCARFQLLFEGLIG